MSDPVEEWSGTLSFEKNVAILIKALHNVLLGVLFHLIMAYFLHLCKRDSSMKTL